MLKLNVVALKEGLRFPLPEAWHDKLVTLGKIANCPYEFIITKVDKDISSKETYYICESEKGKKVQIAIEEYAMKYLVAQEVPDSNIGFSFKDFLPLENTSMLVTNVRNPSEVVPGFFQLEVSSTALHDISFVTLSFKINYMNGIGLASVKYYTEGSKKSTWKFLFHQDESYMSDYEKTFRDTMIHKSYVEKSANKLIRYLEKEGASEHANLLRERAKVHDNSKVSCSDELHALSRIINDKTSLKDASKQLTPLKKDAIALHYKHNTHHPEHFKSVLDMSKLDILEMCCDWHARSSQYGTNFLGYVETQQKERFHFPEWMFSEIWHYCQVLASDI